MLKLTIHTPKLRQSRRFGVLINFKTYFAPSSKVTFQKVNTSWAGIYLLRRMQNKSKS